MNGVRVYTYAGPWCQEGKKMASKAWRQYGKKEALSEELPCKKLGWARLNEILSGQVKKNMAYNEKKKREEEELRKKMDLLKEKEFFRMYMAKEKEEVFTTEVDQRTREWVAKVPNWTIQAGTRVWTYDGPWWQPVREERQPVREERQPVREKPYDLAANGWIFDSTKYLVSQLPKLLPHRKA